MRPKKPITIPTCPLRKPCEFCGEPFGRSLRKNNRCDHVYLVSMKVWETYRYCSNACARKARAAKEREARERRERARKVADSFLFPKGIQL